MRSLIDWPQIRTAPASVVRSLRQIDPTAELIYRGNGRWWLGTVRTHGDSYYLQRADAVKKLTVFASTMSTKRKLGPVGTDKITLALLALQGFKLFDEYEGEPTEHVVTDFRERRWQFQRMTEDDFVALCEQGKEEQRRQAHANMTDPARSHDAWRYAFTLNHLTTRLDDPHKSAQKVPAGRTRHLTIGAKAS